MIENRRERSS